MSPVRVWEQRLLIILFGCLLSRVPLQCQARGSSVPLIQALIQGNLDEARKILHSGSKLNVFDDNGDTPLIAAIRGDYTDFSLELLQAGADPKFTAPGGDTPLMGAAWQRNLTLAKEFVGRRVSINAANAKGITALMFASQTCLDGKMIQLLLDAGADPNAKDQDGATPLLWAAANGNALAAEKVLKAGGDPTLKDKYGNTAESEPCDRGEKGRAQVCALVRQALRKK